jgi:hypothetical protein
VVRATFSDRAQVNRLAAEIAPWEVRHDLRYVVVDVDRAGWQLLLDLGFVPEVDAALTEELLRPRKALPGQVGAIPGYPCYRTVEETFATAQAIVAAHPGLATWTDIGDTWEKLNPGGPYPGYDMSVLRLTQSAVPGPKPRVFLLGSIHAREYTPAETVTRFAELLASGYGVDPDITWFLDHHEVHMVLQGNPDGRKRAETGASWRKNADNSYCANSSLRGADMNRNFPFQWNCCGGGSNNPCSEVYRGPSAASEPENQAIRDYVRAIFADAWTPGPPPPDTSGVFIDLHSSGQLVLWPWGYTTATAPNATALQTLGRKFAYINNYYPEQAIELYITDGASDDFAYGDRGVAAYTFEMGTSFFQSCASFEGTVYPQVRDALLYAVRTARLPYLLPSGPDALGVATVPPGSVNTGQPLVVNATVDDTRYNNINGAEPVQAIAAAEVYLDTPPWTPGAAPVALAAVDGAYDETIEPVTGTLSTAGWPVGRHTLFVRGRDAAGNWGPVSAVFVDVIVPVELMGFEAE